MTFEAFSRYYTHRNFVLFCRIFIGVLFVFFAAIPKILDPVSFAESYEAYNLGSEAFINATSPLAAVFIPWFEFVVGLLFLVGYRLRLAAFGITGLLAVFLVGIGINLVRGSVMDCGCFEFFGLLKVLGIKEELDIWTFVRDIVFIALTLPAFFTDESFFSIDALLKKRSNA